MLGLGRLLAVFSPVTLLNAAAPCAGVERTAGIAFGAGPRDRLDLYRPVAALEDAPVVVFFYGGGWRDGARQDYRFVGAALAARGVVAAIPDYRVWPSVRFPDFLHDAAAAIAWVRRYVAGPSPIFLMGHSAGAHIAAMLGLDGRYLAAIGLVPRRDLAGVIGISGPYDFLPLKSDTLRAIFGPPSALAESQPINFLSAAAPPLLLMTGAADRVVDPANSSRLAARAASLGVPATLRLYPGVGHSLTIGAFAWPLTALVPVLADSLEFIGDPAGRRHAAAPGALAPA